MERIARSCRGRVFALTAVLLLLVVAQALAKDAEDKEPSVKDRVAELEALVASLQSELAAHKANGSAHHTKTTSFAELTADTATDAQIPNNITVDYAAKSGDTDTVDGSHATALDQSGGLAALQSSYNTHAADVSAHHTAVTSFAQLNGTATDAQIPDNITVTYAATSGDADTLDGSHASDLGSADLSDDVTALQDLLEHFSKSGDDIYITGANLHVVNGTDSTDGAPNGLGNIIIGYNERRPLNNDRSGSHMLVVGKYHNYSSFGGILVGYYHTASQKYASVSGGRQNTASGVYASVSGGYGNYATGDHASVTGGKGNEANGDEAVVGGGRLNQANETCSSISGGHSNTANGLGPRSAEGTTTRLLVTTPRSAPGWTA